MESKFIEYFRGLERNYGFCDLSNATVDPETGKLKIPPRDYGWSGKPITDQEYIDHLNGECSIGIQPCKEDGTVNFAAIDVDAYKNFDKEKFLKTIVEKEIPVIPVKSKSGGFHLYLHLEEPVSAVFARSFLKSLLLTLDLGPSTEIFPKQTNVESSVGNFINLPYFGKKDRVAINPTTGTEYTFDQYLQVIEANLQNKKNLEKFMNQLTNKELVGGHEHFNDGPPCLQILTKEELSDGRDRFLYNYMVFAKKKFPDTWEDQIKWAATEFFVNDGVWGEKKVEAKIKSWQKQEKGYTCEDGVITPVCMKDECYKRKFGKKSDNIIQWPELSSLVKILYETPEYDLTVTVRDGEGNETLKAIHCKNVQELTTMRLLRERIIEGIDDFIPKLKDKEFDPIIHQLMANTEVQQPPQGTTNKEKLYSYLKDYIHQVKATSHASFKSGATLIDEKDDLALFVYNKFYEYLRKREWKVESDKTGRWMQVWFGAEFGKRPRYPKKDTQKDSNPQVSGCVAIKYSDFPKEDTPDEIVDMPNREDIL